MKAYSFLGRSTGILGHNSINIWSWDESNGESFGVQLSELTVRGREILWIRDGLSNPLDARILSSDSKRSWEEELRKSRLEERKEAGEQNKERSWEVGRSRERGGGREREKWRGQRAREERVWGKRVNSWGLR